MRTLSGRFGTSRSGTGTRRTASRRPAGWAAVFLLAALVCLPAESDAQSSVTDPDSAWLVDGKVALQFFQCGDGACGRVVWLRKYQDAQGHPTHDKKNPNPALRSRLVCGLTILEGLRPVRPGLWTDGSFYNPHDGHTYNVTAERKSEDVIAARIYIGVPFLGTTKILTRIPREHAEGWC